MFIFQDKGTKEV